MQEYRSILEELLRTTQVVRKNQIANEARQLIDAAWSNARKGATPTDADVEWLLSEIYPWVWGEKSIMNPLIHALDLYARGSAPSGMDIYNILFIAHRLDRSGVIRAGYETYANEPRKLPEPDIRLCAR
jgi:hypothetical protein